MSEYEIEVVPFSYPPLPERWRWTVLQDGVAVQSGLAHTEKEAYRAALAALNETEDDADALEPTPLEPCEAVRPRDEDLSHIYQIPPEFGGES